MVNLSEDKLGFTYAELEQYIRTGICDNVETKQRIDLVYKINLHKITNLMPSFDADEYLKK